MYAAIVVFALGLAILALANHGSVLLLSAAVMGLGFGTIQACGRALMVKVTPLHRMGQATSTFYIFGDTGLGLGPLLCGLLIPLTGYRGMYGVMAAIAVASRGAIPRAAWEARGQVRGRACSLAIIPGRISSAASRRSAPGTHGLAAIAPQISTASSVTYLVLEFASIRTISTECSPSAMMPVDQTFTSYAATLELRSMVATFSPSR